MHLHDFGGQGPRLLFAHAAGLHGLVWEPVAARLTDRFHCTALDLRGHGDTPLRQGDDLHWDGFGHDVLTAAAALGPGEIIGVGHSLGGAALLLAEIMRPGTFSQLILYEPAASLASAAGAGLAATQTAMVAMAEHRQPRFDSKAAALANFSRKEPTAKFSAIALYSYVAHGFGSIDGQPGVTLKCTPDVEAQVFRQGFSHSLARDVLQVKCPVTIVVGRATIPYQHQSALELAEHLGAPVVEIDAVGHFGPLQHPEGFAAVVGRILEPGRHDGPAAIVTAPAGGSTR